EKTVTLKGDAIAEEFQAIVEEYVQLNYAEGGKLRQEYKAVSEAKTIPIRAV
ncbi:MAG: 4-hydroxy-3-methylbut-2-en-1-yl diphosphate synthase, partial [Nitrosomonadales bacterium]|nr:4-hydroxy-3-methylbut-2-en-1-yl diphosphate synthase [Nitrosomonadales bacterium]